MLSERDDLPDGLLDAPASELHDILGGPTLIHLPGRRTPPLFVSVLLHGNETTGFEAVQQLLRPYCTAAGLQPLPRALSLFIGNTRAAQEGVRRLDGQPDFNRIWSGDLYGGCPEQAITARVINIMRQRSPFASVDIHNNTGRNPHYGCVNTLDDKALALAGLFSEVAVYFIKPSEVQSMAFSQFCPAVTLECGQSHETGGVQHAFTYLTKLMELRSLDDLAGHRPQDLYHTTAIVKVRSGFSFAFDAPPSAVDLSLSKTFEHLNFQKVAEGTVFATSRDGRQPLQVISEDGSDVSHVYFDVRDDQLTLKRTVIPAMYTTDTRAICQDCLCYLMEHYPL